MSDDYVLRERVAALEVEVKHVNEKIDEDVTKRLDEMSHMLKEQHDVFMQARGARWVIWTAAGIVSFVVSVVMWFAPSFFHK